MGIEKLPKRYGFTNTLSSGFVDKVEITYDSDDIFNLTDDTSTVRIAREEIGPLIETLYEVLADYPEEDE